MTYISTKKREYISERREFAGEKLRAGTYVCVMQPWPEQYITHRHPFKENTQTYSWPLRFEHCAPQGLGATITLWVECDPDGNIAASDLGEGRFAPLREALRLPEEEQFDTTTLEWSFVKVVVKEKIKGKDANGTLIVTTWTEAILRCDPDEQAVAADYVVRIHPEAA